MYGNLPGILVRPTVHSHDQYRLIFTITQLTIISKFITIHNEIEVPGVRQSRATARFPTSDGYERGTRVCHRFVVLQ